MFVHFTLQLGPEWYLLLGLLVFNIFAMQSSSINKEHHEVHLGQKGDHPSRVINQIKRALVRETTKNSLRTALPQQSTVGEASCCGVAFN